MTWFKSQKAIVQAVLVWSTIMVVVIVLDFTVKLPAWITFALLPTYLAFVFGHGRGFVEGLAVGRKSDKEINELFERFQ